jgi:hypothetical protein
MNTDINTNALTLEDLAATIGGKAWIKGQMQRIYMPVHRKDAKVYFDFADGIDGGAALKVWIDDCGQSPKWYASQRDMLRSRFAAEALALMAAQSEAGAAGAAKILELRAALTAEAIDELAGHLTNGRTQECDAKLAALQAAQAEDI